MDDLKLERGSIELFLAELYVPDCDCKRYAEELFRNGYEDISCLQGHVPVALLESFMRPGHAERVIRRLEALKDEDTPRKSIFQKYGGKHHGLQINMDHNPETVERLTCNPEHGCYRTGNFEISPAGIDCAPKGLPWAMAPSMASPKYTQEAIIVLREIGRGACGVVYKCLYIPTLTYVAVKCIQVSNQSKRNQILTELTLLYTVSNARLVLGESFEAPSVTIPPINSYTLPKGKNSEGIFVRAKEVSARGPNTIKLSLPKEHAPKHPHHPPHGSHIVPLVDEVIPPRPYVDPITDLLPVLNADTALCDRMKVLGEQRSDSAAFSAAAATPVHRNVQSDDNKTDQNGDKTQYGQQDKAQDEAQDKEEDKAHDREKDISDKPGGPDGATVDDPPHDTVPAIQEMGYKYGPCPYIVTFYDAYTDPPSETVCLVMEFMGGGSIQNLIDLKYPAGEKEVAVVAYSVLRALEELHSRKIIHRDIKPANILCSAEGKVKLSDFGIVREVLNCEEPDTFTGTLDYMCPQRLRGQPYNFESDVWSLGSCLVAFMTGRSPFPNVHQSFKSVFEKKHMNSYVPSRTPPGDSSPSRVPRRESKRVSDLRTPMGIPLPPISTRSVDPPDDPSPPPGDISPPFTDIPPPCWDPPLPFGDFKEGKEGAKGVEEGGDGRYPYRWMSKMREMRAITEMREMREIRGRKRGNSHIDIEVPIDYSDIDDSCSKVSPWNKDDDDDNRERDSNSNRDWDRDRDRDENRDRCRDIDRDRERDKDRDIIRDAGRDIDRDIVRDIDRDIDRDTDRDIDRDRERGIERERLIVPDNNLAAMFSDLPTDKYSDKLRSFLGLCLAADTQSRPTASALLQHPFIRHAAQQGWISPPMQPLLSGLPKQKASRNNVKGILRCILDWSPEHANEMIPFRTQPLPSAPSPSSSLSWDPRRSRDHERESSKEPLKGPLEPLIQPLTEPVEPFKGPLEPYKEPLKPLKQPPTEPLSFSMLPIPTTSDASCRLSLSAIRHLSGQLNVEPEKLISVVKRIQRERNEEDRALAHGIAPASEGNTPAGAVKANCLQDEVTPRSPFSVSSTTITLNGKRSSKGEEVERMAEEVVKSKHPLTMQKIASLRISPKTPPKEEQLAVSVPISVSLPMAVRGPPQRAFQPHRAHYLKHFVPHGQGQGQGRGRGHGHCPPQTITSTDLITSTYHSVSGKSNKSNKSNKSLSNKSLSSSSGTPSDPTGIWRGTGTWTGMGSETGPGTESGPNPTELPTSTKSNPGYISTLPPLRHCRSLDSVLTIGQPPPQSVPQSVPLPPRVPSPHVTAVGRSIVAPVYVSSLYDWEPASLQHPDLIAEAGVSMQLIRATEAEKNGNQTGAIGAVKLNVAASKVEVGEGRRDINGEVEVGEGRRDINGEVEVGEERDYWGKVGTPRGRGPSSGVVSPSQCMLSEDAIIEGLQEGDASRMYPSLSISIPKDIYIPPAQTPDTCPLRRVASTCSLYDCYDGTGKQIGCDRDGNPIADPEGNLRSLSSVSFPRHTPQGYTPRHSPGDPASRLASPRMSPRDCFMGAYSPSLVSAVIHSTPGGTPRVEDSYRESSFMDSRRSSFKEGREGAEGTLSISPPANYHYFNHYDTNCNSAYNSTYNSNNNSLKNGSSSNCSRYCNRNLSEDGYEDDSACASPSYGYSLYRNCEDYDDNYVGLPSILSGSRCSSVTDSVYIDSDCFLTPPESPVSPREAFRRIESITELVESEGS